MKIIVTKPQFNRIVEGAEFYNMKQDGAPMLGASAPIGMRINTKKTDIDNDGTDTRFLGTPDDIMYGDGSTSSPNLYQQVQSAKRLKDFYEKVLEYYHNGQQGSFPQIPDDISFQTKAAMRRAMAKIDNAPDNVKESMIENYISMWAKAYAKWQMYYNSYNSTFKNAQKAKENGKNVAPRYSKGIVPQTDVEYFALFKIGSFNFSDAIKHGRVRQTSDEFDNLLGISKSERLTVPSLSRGKNPFTKIDVYYDDDNLETANAYNSRHTFSLPNDDTDHQKINAQSKNEYNSVQQFLDKSIIAANYVLTKENFKPDFIIAPPSSSKFNEHYCMRLSKKINAQYLPDFFEKNATEIVYDRESALKSGLTTNDLIVFDMQINQAVRSEIGYICGKPISEFMDQNANLFKKIRLAKSSRNFAPFSLVKQIYVNYINDLVYKYFESSDDLDAITNYVISAAKKVAIEDTHQITGYDHDFLLAQIKKVTNRHGGMLRDANNTFARLINETVRTVNYYRKRLTDGYKINFNSSAFKIVKFDMRFRPFVTNLYVIARKNFNKNHDLLSRYKNAKFLIFDEDLNSGGTLKNVISTLVGSLPANYNSAANIKCLVNGIQLNSK